MSRVRRRRPPSRLLELMRAQDRLFRATVPGCKATGRALTCPTCDRRRIVYDLPSTGVVACSYCGTERVVIGEIWARCPGGQAGGVRIDADAVARAVCRWLNEAATEDGEPFRFGVPS